MKIESIDFSELEHGLPILREHLMLAVSGWKHAGAKMQGGL